jgi:hypothetical protein
MFAYSDPSFLEEKGALGAYHEIVDASSFAITPTPCGWTISRR